MGRSFYELEQEVYRLREQLVALDDEMGKRVEELTAAGRRMHLELSAWHAWATANPKYRGELIRQIEACVLAGEFKAAHENASLRSGIASEAGGTPVEASLERGPPKSKPSEPVSEGDPVPPKSNAGTWRTWLRETQRKPRK